MVKPIPTPIKDPPPSARRNRGDTALIRLRRDLLLGRYRPGTRLPPERELAARLGTNRNTLRETLRILESENLVRARQGDGTIVLDWRRVGEVNLLPQFLAEETPADERFEAVLTLLNLRERLLDEVLGRATTHASAADLDAIQEALLELQESRGDEFIAADIEVYRRIVVASHSLALVWVFNTFAKIFLELGDRFPHLWENDDHYLEGLARVLRWLKEKRPDRAREEMRHVFEERGMALVAILRPDAISAERERVRVKPRAARR